MPQFLFALLLSLSSSALLATELTLFGGTQGGGDLNHIDTNSTLRFEQSPAHALILGRPLDHNRDLELFYSQQQTRLGGGSNAVPAADQFDVDIHYLHLGGTVLSEERNGWQGFLSGGLGLSHFSPSLGGATAENRASMSLGLGARWMSHPRLGLRLESRLYGTLFNSNTAIFCSGGCQLSVSGDLLSQYAIFAGVVVRLD
jgi:hypothetical protein